MLKASRSQVNLLLDPARDGDGKVYVPWKDVVLNVSLTGDALAAWHRNVTEKSGGASINTMKDIGFSDLQRQLILKHDFAQSRETLTMLFSTHPLKPSPLTKMKPFSSRPSVTASALLVKKALALPSSDDLA